MKNALVMLSSLFFLVGCKFSGGGSITSFIPGTYIRFSEHEYGREYDTLAIALQNGTAKEYAITRRWRYERVLDGQKVEPKYEIKTTTALFDKGRNLLREIETGESYSFNPGKNVLYAGKNAYQKIK
jgi:hypothetical protein